jgi:hypothetical protein
MSEEKNVIINFNGREYTAEDLNEEQTRLAVELNVAGRELAELQRSYNLYNMINNHKNILIEAFDKTLPKEEEVTEEN